VNWALIGQWTVMLVIGSVLVGAVWLKVEEDQQHLDYEEQLRIAQGYDDADEYTEPTPPKPPRRAA
jgi:hypothetical protein